MKVEFLKGILPFLLLRRYLKSVRLLTLVLNKKIGVEAWGNIVLWFPAGFKE